MTKITRKSLLIFLAVVLLAMGLPFTSHGQSKFVTRRGKEFISPNGKPLLVGAHEISGTTAIYQVNIIPEPATGMLALGGIAMLAMVHGILAGSDSGEQWAQLSYLSSGLCVLFFTFFRILASKRAERAAKAAPKASPAATEGAPASEPAAA